MKEVEEYLRQNVAQEKTRRIYLRDLEQVREFLEKDFLEVEEADLQKYFDFCQQSLKESSLRRKQSVLRKFYQYLLTERKIQKNPFPVISTTYKKEEKQEKERLSQEEYELLLTKLPEEMKVLTEMLWETEAKILDLFDVRVESLREYDYKKIVGKRQGKVYSYEIPEFLQEAFQKMVEGKQPEEKVFHGNRQQYDKELKKINETWKASQIKKESWKSEKIEIEKIREHYFEIGIGDK
ncbi:phage integrase SAM-like domain protein [Fusobacterium gonidiaformans 3-1-5R]|uniref:Phage integrase SAM-like domain protein n=1 Tax=Fusobacterium gonidiaformans 3-1-5R TaxID=469605 RepID=E5BH63_9FUSO|nr:site-specific integrase [Fusobacterium gonidiaformans]EFS21836.1 phage integrase SAM-like domain protein [Fusobacterium gonidiaformans 3-1-5R]